MNWAPWARAFAAFSQPPDERLRDATIWVTGDAEHVLLRIRSEMFVGAITLDLLSREVLS